MRLISITANNYRTLQNITIPFSENYCTISGRNNAGKSCIIRLLTNLLRRDQGRPWLYEDYLFEYKEDKTQWVKDDKPIEIEYLIQLSIEDDPALIKFIEKISTLKISNEIVKLAVLNKINSSDDIDIIVKVNGSPVETQASMEIVKRLKTSNLLFLYNSATSYEEIYYRRGRKSSFYEVVLSEDEQKQLDDASKQVDRKIKRLAKEHKEALSSLIGKLSEKFDVEFSTIEGYSTKYMPFGINLRDKNVEVPLNSWGSGTQNRTHILMAILQAKRIKSRETEQEKITPIVVIEEPESFLHPSAQSEFGKVLRSLSSEFGIQIIVTTHSPYMLNQEDATSNILLSRESRRNKPFETCLVSTVGDNWMAPFAEHLGISSLEFQNWRPVFSSYKSKVLLVEGDIDKEYFEYLRSKKIGAEILYEDIEIVPYGGKDALRNTMLVKFVLSKFDFTFITFDLDCYSEVASALNRVGLIENENYIPIGLNKPGKDSIEGLLPERVLTAVYSKEPDLVLRLGSKDKQERKKAKDILKKRYLEEFKKYNDYKGEELREITKVIKAINRGFKRPAHKSK